MRNPTWRPLAGVVAAVILVGIILVGRSLAKFVPALTAGIERLGPRAPIAFIGLYAVAAIAFVPGSLLTLAAGALFGLVRGTVYVMIGATLGASGAFLLARYAARAAIERRVRASPRFAALDAALESQGRKIVLLLRLSPLVPYNLLNYFLGVTRVRFGDFLPASIGMLPGTILYVYYGKVAGDVAALALGTRTPRGAAYYALLGAGLLATIAVTLLVTRAARRALPVVAPPES